MKRNFNVGLLGFIKYLIKKMTVGYLTWIKSFFGGEFESNNEMFIETVFYFMAYTAITLFSILYIINFFIQYATHTGA